ncbi:small ribosomal subunit protein mS27-like [Amphiura filiformis]|uniref:small ribosomal subunit protein mS27-like n=1 Tax=Amphiura filiformis TaxID=82378 RepID=UPI003B227952
MAAPCGRKSVMLIVKNFTRLSPCRISPRFLQVHQLLKTFQGCRTVMSESFVNTDVWRQRRKLNTNMNELSIQLDRDFYDEKRPVASVELHKFIDNMADSDDVEIAQGYLYCHRHSVMAPHLKDSTRHCWIRGCMDYNREDVALTTLKERVSLLKIPPGTVGGKFIKDSTRHCWIRGCMDYNREDVALTTLKERTHYGIFLDSYTFSLFIDSYLKKNNFKGAAMVAVEMMNQEVLDETEPLLQLLALYACHMYMAKEQPAQEESWNVGMTVADASRGQTTLLGRSYHVLGYAMTGNLNKTLRILQSVESEGDEAQPCIVQEAVDKLKNLVDNQAEKDEHLISQIQEIIDKLQSEGKISSESLDSLIPTQLLNHITQYENNYITGYAQKLQEWHQEYLDGMQKMQELEKEQEIAQKLTRLDELRMEVEGLEYAKEKIAEEKEKQNKAEEEKHEQNLQTAS